MSDKANQAEQDVEMSSFCQNKDELITESAKGDVSETQNNK